MGGTMRSSGVRLTVAQRLGGALLLSCVAALVLGLDLGAQQVGSNVSVVTGPDSPFAGDPFLQRQNEAVLAISTRNPDHLMVAMNDYSTVDIAFDPAPEGGNNGLIARDGGPVNSNARREVRTNASPEAWIGLAFSQNRGASWYKSLLPGFPQDTSAVGKGSPLYGLTAGSDPVLVAGPHGRFYLGGLVFDRDGFSRIFAARYTDRNAEEGGETIHYDFARIVHQGSQSAKGRFTDKPSIGIYAGDAGTFSASTSAKKGRKERTIVVAGCERTYISYTMFEGLELNGQFRSAVYTSYSADCGDHWSNPIKISGPYSVGSTNVPGTRNQGTAIAIDPNTGYVYVAWRVYGPDGYVIVRSTDGGITYSSPTAITGASPVYAFDQPTIPVTQGFSFPTFRTNAYPSLVVHEGRLAAGWQERVNVTPFSASFGLPAATGEPRIVVTFGQITADGAIAWTPRRAADLGDAGLSTPGQRCEVQGPGEPPTCRPTGQQVMPHLAARDAQLMLFYYEGRGPLSPETGFISGIDRQVDVRAALIDATGRLVSSFQVSRYTIDSSTGRIMNAPGPEPPGPRVSYANAPLYRGGLAPFAGDYPHLIPLRPDGSGPGFRAVWTDNRDVVFPPNWDFTAYSGPWTGELSACNPGARDSNIYSAEIGTGLVVGAPGNFKQLLDANGQPVQRAFAVYVENHTAQHRAFRMAFESVDTGVAASFEQFSPLTVVDVEVLAGSSIARSAYLTGNVATGAAVVSVREINPVDRTLILNGLSASVTLNGDPTNPLVAGGADGNNLANTETHNPQLGSPQLSSPQLGSPQLGSPQLGSPQLGSPQVSSPQVSSTAESASLTTTTAAAAAPLVDKTITDITFEVTNDGNTASGYNALVALLNAPELATTEHTFQVLVYRTHQTPGMDACEQVLKQQDQLLFISPQLGSPQLGSPQLGSPQLGSPQLGSPQLGSPQLGSPQLGSPQLASTSFAAAPADPSPGAHDGTIHEHIKRDVIKLTLRIFHPSEQEADTHDPQTDFLDQVAVAVTAQAANTGETEPPSDGYNDELLGTGFIVTNTNDSGPGSLRDALTAANGNPGLDTVLFAIPGAGPFTIAPLAPLPAATDPLVIDGMSQPGFAGTPVVELAGGEGLGTGLTIAGGSSTVRGLVIRGFPQSGIQVTGAGSNFIVGNYIGTDVSGTEASANSGNGVHVIDSPNNFIGGPGPAARNVIAASGGEGVRIDGALSTGNVIRGNYVGTAATGNAALGNSASGIYIRRAPGNLVIGNLVSGNTGFAGVAICGSAAFCGGGDPPGSNQASNAAGNVVQGNLIGTNADGSAALGNSGFGVSIDGAPGTVVGGPTADERNVIAHNGNDGVVVFNPPASGNRIRGNRIFNNAGLGIDLRQDNGEGGSIPGVTLNDLGIEGPPDLDVGVNGLQNFPELEAVTPGDGSTVISGTLISTPLTTFTIDFYANDACDPSGHGEGAMLVGSIDVTTDGTGSASFSPTLALELPEGQVVTATATDPGGNTSEFSECVTVGDVNLAGGALSFDGINDIAVIPDDASLDLTASLTVEAWVLVSSPDFFRRPVLSKGTNLGNYTLGILGDDTEAVPGSVELSYATGTGNVSCCGGPPTIVFGEWTHVAATFVGGVLRVYINGEFVDSVSDQPGPTANTANLVLGRALYLSGGEIFTADHYAGVIDEVRVWNVARSAAEIAASYNKLVSPTSPGLVGYWRFDEAAGDQNVTDLSPSGNHGTLGLDGLSASDDPARVVSTAPIVP